MEIILTQNVEKLGLTGQKVTVKGGYARNFLIPRGLALPATASARAQSHALAAAGLRAAQKAKEKAVALAGQVEQALCTIPMVVGEQGKLHGAVTADTIASSLQGQGLSIDRHQLEMERPLAQLGEFEIRVRLHPEVKASLRVRIVRKE